MTLSKQIIEFGLTEDYIRYLHSKTKLSKLTIESVEHVRNNYDTIVIRLRLIGSGHYRQMSLEVSKSKIREKKLNQLLH